MKGQIKNDLRKIFAYCFLRKINKMELFYLLKDLSEVKLYHIFKELNCLEATIRDRVLKYL